MHHIQGKADGGLAVAAMVVAIYTTVVDEFIIVDAMKID